jgi:hypothetical protein
MRRIDVARVAAQGDTTAATAAATVDAVRIETSTA